MRPEQNDQMAATYVAVGVTVGQLVEQQQLAHQ